MADKTKYRNVSLSHETYETLQQLSKVLLPGSILAISKTVEAVSNSQYIIILKIVVHIDEYKSKGLKIIYHPYTKGISTTIIRSNIK